MKLYKGRFISWLKQKSPDAIVGINRDCHSCPIAKFYYDASGGCEVVIFDEGNRRMIDRGYSKKPLPDWADRFAWSIDGDSDGQISAGRALELLYRDNDQLTKRRPKRSAR